MTRRKKLDQYNRDPFVKDPRLHRPRALKMKHPLEPGRNALGGLRIPPPGRSERAEMARRKDLKETIGQMRRASRELL